MIPRNSSLATERYNVAAGLTFEPPAKSIEILYPEIPKIITREGLRF
jgi:hypothetical protein